MNLEEFLKSDQRNAWIREVDGLRVYVRNSRRYWRGVEIRPLDIASVEIEASLRGKGSFTRFLDRVEELVLPTRPVYIETVLDKRFQEFFVRRGYEPATAENNFPLDCFLKTR